MNKNDKNVRDLDQTSVGGQTCPLISIKSDIKIEVENPGTGISVHREPCDVKLNDNEEPGAKLYIKKEAEVKERNVRKEHLPGMSNDNSLQNSGDLKEDAVQSSSVAEETYLSSYFEVQIKDDPDGPGASVSVKEEPSDEAFNDNDSVEDPNSTQCINKEVDLDKTFKGNPEGAVLLHSEPELFEFECNQCQKTFRNVASLNQHSKEHYGSETFQCHLCDKSFAYLGGLTVHLRTHSGIKPFQCRQCDKSFSQSGALTTHLRTHSGLKPFQCDQCDKSFAQSGGLTVHLRKHSGIKPFKCDQCDISFAHSCSLELHLRKHSTVNSVIKAFKCDQCNKSFSRSRSLTSHLRTHSGITH